MPDITHEAAYRAHTNIALIKYWGKRHPELFLPVTSSLSLTLDAFYTETRIQFSPDYTSDTLYLNHKQMEADEMAHISHFVDLFRQEAGVQAACQINSINHVPTAAGLASSASAFAALGSACNTALGLNMDAQQLSTFVRQGSGSASRSVHGGFVLWHRGEGDVSSSSFTEQIDDANWDIGMLVVAVNTEVKPFSSRAGMQHTVETSPFYQQWPAEVEKDLALMLEAIKAQDFTTMGEISEHNAMKMHATMLAAKPSFTYFQGESILAMHLVQKLRREGLECYYTMDAGPNVKVLCRQSDMAHIKAAFAIHFKPDQLIEAKPGPGPEAIQWKEAN